MSNTWTATKIPADMAQNIQVNAGILLNSFNVAAPAEPADSAIICATTGDFGITCQPETEDFFEDVNNAPNGTKEGKRITGWNCELTVKAIEITEETLKLALGAAETGLDGGINPRAQYKLSDFKSLYWIGDMVDEDKLFCVVMDNTVSTGGVSFSSTKNGKGGIDLTLTPHASLANPTKVPMAFYILEKGTGIAAVNVTSAAGTTTGYTALTVSGYSLGSGESWKYKIGDEAEIVHYGADLIRWTDWDGDDEILAATGKVITVAAVDSTDYAVAAGFTTVTAKAAS